VNALLALSLANLKSFVRDRAALFWTLAFPILFVILFGTIFAGGGELNYDVGWVDQDRTAASAKLRTGFEATGVVSLQDGSLDAERDAMRRGDIDAILVVPAGVGAALGAAGPGAGTGGGEPTASILVYVDPSRTNASQALVQIANGVAMATNLALTGQSPVLGVESETLQTQRLSNVSYFVPSILAMALMQLGVFAAIPLVQQREKGILKRLGATPLPRWTLVGSNIAVRLVIAATQTALILGIGIGLLQVEVTGNWPLIVGVVVLGALSFVSIGYVIASFARTEEAANGMTSIVQFPLMFLSGIFFPLEIMPDWLRSIATFLPLTYLGDALRQTMVGGTPFVPLGLDVAILGGWLVACLAIAARFFRWQ
jgi:ABC-2 type transport system permease protein